MGGRGRGTGEKERGYVKDKSCCILSGEYLCQDFWVPADNLPPKCCIHLGKLLNFSELPFPP